jgi:hypothetical protein
MRLSRCLGQNPGRELEVYSSSMRLVIFCLLFLSLLTHAESDFSDASDSAKIRAEVEEALANNPESDDSRVIAQVRNYRNRKIKKPKFITYKSIHSAKFKGYKVTEIPKYEIPPLLSREDLNKIIPNGVTATEPSDEVLKKIGDKAVNVWLKSSSMQKVSLVQAAQKVEQAMKAEVNLAPEDADVKQKLNFQVQAFQSVSKIDYTGYVDATVSYNMREQKTGYEVRRKVMHNKDLFVNHTATKEENLSTVGLKWSF